MIRKATAKDLIDYTVRCCEVCGKVDGQLYCFTSEAEQITLFVCEQDARRLCEKNYKAEIDHDGYKRRHAEIFGG